MECQNINSQHNIEKKKSWRVDTTQPKICYKATLSERACISKRKDILIKKQIRNPEIESDKYSTLLTVSKTLQ